MTWKSKRTRRNSIVEGQGHKASLNTAVPTDHLCPTIPACPHAAKPLPHADSHVRDPPTMFPPRPFYPCLDPCAIVSRFKKLCRPRQHAITDIRIADTNTNTIKNLDHNNVNDTNFPLPGLNELGSPVGRNKTSQDHFLPHRNLAIQRLSQRRSMDSPGEETPQCGDGNNDWASSEGHKTSSCKGEGEGGIPVESDRSKATNQGSNSDANEAGNGAIPMDSDVASEEDGGEAETQGGNNEVEPGNED